MGVRLRVAAQTAVSDSAGTDPYCPACPPAYCGESSITESTHTARKVIEEYQRMAGKSGTTTPASDSLTADQILRIALSEGAEQHNAGNDFGIFAQYRRMLVTRDDGQQVEMEGLLVRLSTGMAVIITPDGDHGVTVETLTQWPTFLSRPDHEPEPQGSERGD